MLAVGSAGVYASADGGVTWTLRGQFPVHTTGFQAVGGSLVEPVAGTLYASVCNGAAVGNGGCANYLFGSTDGGHAWRQLWQAYCTRLALVHMVTATTGVLVLTGSTACEGPSATSNVVLGTHDGFRHLTRWATLPENVSAVSWLNATTGIVAGPPLDCLTVPACMPELSVTNDGGRLWTVVAGSPTPTLTVAESPDGHLYGLRVAQDRLGWMTSASGNRWTVIATGIPLTALQNPCGPGLTQMEFPAPPTGFLAVGGHLFKTTNGGQTLTPLPAPPAGLLVTAMAFVSATRGYAVLQNGCNPHPEGRPGLYITTDGGRQWRRDGTVPAPLGVAFVTPMRGWILAAPSPAYPQGRLWETTDGGRHWAVFAWKVPPLASLLNPIPGVAELTGPTGVTLFTPRDAPAEVALRLNNPNALASGAVLLPEPGRRLLLFLPGFGLWQAHVAARLTFRPLHGII